jgi:4-hydroxy-4-methyl-2-oxoglutarate aldolase
MELEAALVLNAHDEAFSIGDGLTRFAGGTAVGEASCVRSVAGDNLALHQLIERSRPGQVLVCQITSDYPAGYFGEMMALASKQKKLAGLVIDGTIRDVDKLQMIAFPVFAKGIGLRDTTKLHPGVPPIDSIRFRHGCVRNGDLVVADGSGVVVVPKSCVADCLRHAVEIKQKERITIKRILRGESTCGALGLGVQ